MTGWRLDEGGAIDRAAPIGFSFDGHALSGFAGDTLASALLASGQRIVGRSFKYHRPRGIWGAGAEEPNAILDVTEGGRTIPNIRATTESLREGMVLRSVNAWPEAARDRMGFLDRLHRFLPAGFYYKTFMAPDWMRWEPSIRRMAGLGRLDPNHAPPADCAQMNATADMLVIGAGPAGLAAARAAADAGRSVWLVDDQEAPGGSLRWRGGSVDGEPWQAWLDDTLARITSAGGRVITGTTAWGAFDHGLFAAWERRGDRPDRLWRIRAEDAVLAAGAIERPLWFADNDLPGVMSAEAALRYLRLHAAVCGRQIVLATGNDGSYPVAAALAEAGCEVTLVDARSEGPQAPDGVALRRNARVTGAEGRDGVTRVRLDEETLQADTLLVSGGLTPSVHLFMQAGGKLDWNATRDALIPRPGSAPLRVAGAANGTFALADVLAEGHAAGGGTGAGPKAAAGAWSLVPMRPDPALPGRQWIDQQNDVTLGDVELAQREGFVSVEHLKRYTTLGMATDQGRSSNFAGLAAMATLTHRTIPETGTTTYRPPFTPVPLTVVAGRRRGLLFDPPKRLPLETRHRAAGASLREYGGWLRPSHYGADAEAVTAQREACTARETAALYDASPLGKIEVVGPLATELLDFCFFTRMSTLKAGRARYGLMLSETGIVYDDGVTLRLAEDRFIVSPSSSHVEGVRMRLEDARQDRFDPSRVFLHDVTAHWTTLALAGPRAREVLQAAGFPVDLSDEVLPHMGVTETLWDGRPVRVARISFTGERSYEVSVPARHAEWLADLLGRALETHDGTLLGMEGLLLLRAEKGFILIGKDTDGLTMPQDLGWRGKRGDEFIGKRSLLTEEARREDRRQLVGLAVPDGEPTLKTGAHLVPLEGERRSLGFVTSSGAGPGAGRPVALALLEAGRDRIGQEVGVFHNGAVRTASIVRPCAFDPEGKRLHA